VRIETEDPFEIEIDESLSQWQIRGLHFKFAELNLKPCNIIGFDWECARGKGTT